MDKLFPPPETQDSVAVKVTENPQTERPEVNVDKKVLALKLRRKTISDSYLGQFTSLREFVQPANEEEKEETIDGVDDNVDNHEKEHKKKTLLPPGFFVSNTVKMVASHDRKKVFLFKLNFMERIFLTLHRPASSQFSKLVSNFMMIVIVISCVFFVISTDRDVKSVPSSCINPTCEDDPLLCPGETMCEPVEPAWFFTVELTCIVIFTIDYGLRVGIVAFVPPRLSNMVPRKFDAIHIHDPYEVDPVISKPRIIFNYVTNVMNLIDVVAILPFYFGLMTNTQSSVSVIRILRLGRMMRVFKVGKYNVGTRLLVETIRESIPALSLLMFFTLLLVVLFGSLVFFAEGGEYTISADYPDGAYLRTNLFNNGKEESPFLSIIVSCWWVVVTMTTVGYGDLYPTTSFGRLMGVCCMLIGILALALPIGVMGSSFNRNYAKFHGTIEDNLRASQNVADMNSFDLKEVMVYELNNEVVVRGTDDDDEGIGGDDDSEKENSLKLTGAIGMASTSTATLSCQGSSADDEKVGVKDTANINSEKDQSGETEDSTKLINDTKYSPANLSDKLSNKEIRERLQMLSGEINFLMNALGDNDD